MANDSNISLTSSARRHVESILARETDGIGLRLGVKKTGCSGYQYVIETAKAVHAEDQTMEVNGITLVIDKQSLPYLAGTELDFVREGLNAEFKFRNPNVNETCGCGTSFSLKEDTQTQQ